MNNKKVLDCDKYYRKMTNFDYLYEWKYQITKEIGRGGYGVVYKVINIHMTRSSIVCVREQIMHAKSTLPLFLEK